MLVHQKSGGIVYIMSCLSKTANQSDILLWFHGATLVVISTIYLAVSHHMTCRACRECILDNSSFWKGQGEKGRERVEKKCPLQYVFSCAPIFIFVDSLWYLSLHCYLSSLLPSPAFGLAPFCPHLNPLTTWHDLDPNLGHLYWSSMPLHVTPCYSLKLIVASTSHIPFV